jgi:hypothetical protein
MCGMPVAARWQGPYASSPSLPPGIQTKMGLPETSFSQHEPHIRKLFCERTTAPQNFFQIWGSYCENNLSA